jgi:hypothetical protein
MNNSYQLRTVSQSDTCHACVKLESCASRLEWVITTPFGLFVVPDVYLKDKTNLNSQQLVSNITKITK